MKIGIGITTTTEREELFAETRRRINSMRPEGSVLTFNCDKWHVGVAHSKNHCLDILYGEGCDHIFLFDDDCWPISKEWWRPYVEHPEPHLMYQFKLKGKPRSDMLELYRDETTVAYSHTRGAMLYIERRVLDAAGGMDTRFKNGFEHPEWTNRIHNAGLTTHRAMDVPDSNKLLYCLDQDGLVKSSIKSDTTTTSLNRQMYRESMGSREYKEFRS